MSGDIDFKSLKNLSAAIAMLYFAFFAGTLSAQPIMSAIASEGVEFEIQECAEIPHSQGRLEELVACYRNNGFPYAFVCTQSALSTESHICFGPIVRIAEYYFSEELPLRNSLIHSLGGFRRGQLYNHQQVLEFVSALERHLGIQQANATFEQIGMNSVRMIITGHPPRNSIRTSIFWDSDSRNIGSISGQYFASGSSPGTREYFVNFSSSGVSELGFSTPISIDENQVNSIHGRIFNLEGRYSEVQGVSFQFNVAPRGSDISYLGELETYGFEVASEEHSALGHASWRDDYLRLYSNWSIGNLGIFESGEMNFNFYLANGRSITSNVRIFGATTQTVSNNPEITFRNRSYFGLMMGQTSNAPLSERLFLGGQNLRGFYPTEIGRSLNQDFSDWGLRWSLSSQFELLWSIEDFFRNSSVGMHLDFGFGSSESLGTGGYASFGLISELRVFDDVSLQLSLSRNNFSHERASMRLNLLN